MVVSVKEVIASQEKEVREHIPSVTPDIDEKLHKLMPGLYITWKVPEDVPGYLHKFLLTALQEVYGEKDWKVELKYDQRDGYCLQFSHP